MKTRSVRYWIAAAMTVSTAGLLLLSVLGVRGISAPAQDQNSQFSLEGTITEVSPGKLTVSTEGNIIFHVTYDDKTEIHRKDGSAGSAKDLAAGEKIKVDGMLTPAGLIEAQRIDLE